VVLHGGACATTNQLRRTTWQRPTPSQPLPATGMAVPVLLPAVTNPGDFSGFHTKANDLVCCGYKDLYSVFFSLLI